MVFIIEELLEHSNVFLLKKNDPYFFSCLSFSVLSIMSKVLER
jgi:hypothetical protein